jgi:DNA-binding HxlR family transcriptional regulator
MKPQHKKDDGHPTGKFEEVQCPIAKIIKIVGAKWTLRVIHRLTGGTKRFGELLKELPGISPRTLSARLVTLEKNKLIKKKTYNVVPPHTEYTLTDRGVELKRVFTELNDWYKKFSEEK